jgi:site-specific DNA-methyltransferase (adenine-specific)
LRVERIGNATLYLGDCLTILPTLGKVDSVITDPPYGVGVDYGSFEDTPEYVTNVVVPAIQSCRDICSRVVLTSGNKCVWAYPPPDDWGVWFNPAGTGFGKWGFNLAHMILYYGKDPKPKTAGSSVTGMNDRAERQDHPCPKPFGIIRWLMDKASFPGDVVLDPFMGSGTTGEVALRYDRKFIGIEIDPKYFDIACERIENAQRQERLFA